MTPLATGSVVVLSDVLVAFAPVIATVDIEPCSISSFSVNVRVENGSRNHWILDVL
jgi:hypothetical protein